MIEPAKTRWAPVALAVCASLAALPTFVALLVMATLQRSSSYGLMWFLREGGFGSWGILLLTAFSTVATAALAAWLTLRKGAWAWALAVLPLVVVLAAALFELLGMTKVLGAIRGATVDPAQKFRILAEGTSETTVLGILGGLAGCALMSSIACVLGARALSRVGKAGFGLPMIGALAAGIFGLSAIGLLSFVWPAFSWSGIGFGWLPALAAVAASVLAGAALSDKSADDEARGAALGDLAMAGCYAGVGVLLACASVHGLGFRRLMAATGGESVDPSQSARIAGEGLALMSASFTAHLLWLVPVLLAVSAAAIPALHTAGRAVARAWAGLASVLVVGVLALMMIVAPRASREKRLGEMHATMAPANFELVAVDWLEPKPSGNRIYIGKETVLINGKDVARTDALDGPLCEAVVAQAMLDSDHRLQIAPDPSVPFQRVACVLGKLVGSSRNQQRFEFLVRMRNDAKLPPPWDTLSPTEGTVPCDVRARATPPMTDHVHLGVETWEMRIGEKRETLSGSLDDRLRELVDRVPEEPLGVTVDPQVPIGTLLRLASRGHRFGLTLDLYKSKDEALASPRAGNPDDGIGLGNLGSLGSNSGSDGRKKPMKLRMGATTVNGRLPPEVIQRIVRQNFGRFRLCYENGARTNPTLEGRVTVKFVIGRDGSVASAQDSGSDLPDKMVVTCVVNAFKALSFPQPEGGIVVVTYPLLFSPGE